ncbi:hypothetical protein [Bradyrhizobium sp.]|uniref:hypothetical protein n=1 Tax=Bradyrhizobium sp. TaxID=376 RepID=UPI0039E2EE8F
MTYLASLHSRVAELFAHLRERRRHFVDSHSRDRDNDPDDFYEIFLFGPHG